jgi:hypothetical protein
MFGPGLPSCLHPPTAGRPSRPLAQEEALVLTRWFSSRAQKRTSVLRGSAHKGRRATEEVGRGRNRVLRKLIVAASLGLLAGAIPVASVAAAPTTDPSTHTNPTVTQAATVQYAPHSKNAKADSQVVAIIDSNSAQGAAAALQVAEKSHIQVAQSKVRVILETTNPAQAAQKVRGLGVIVEGTSANLIQVLVAPGQLQSLTRIAEVTYVRAPFPFFEAAVTNEAVASTNAGAWHTGGRTGSGVKVAIIDAGFTDYAASQSSGDLPASLTTVDYCGGDLNTASEHGTAVAEVVYKLAPDAQLYLICIGTEVDLATAEQYVKSHGITIVNTSLGWTATSRGDGSGAAGTPDAIVADAAANGILWISSAGNDGQRHWSGTYTDNGYGWNDFGDGDIGNTFYLPSGYQMCAGLKWDSWPASAQDYDLYIMSESAGPTYSDTGYDSVDAQTGSQAPTEFTCFPNFGASGNFAIMIKKYSATVSPRMDLYVKYTDIQYHNADGSIAEPASSPSAFAVGAVCWASTTIESFSSQGPTIDGRTKPDLAGPDQMSTVPYGAFTNCADESGFAGTSASAPAVTGAAALVASANPSFTPAQIRSYLQDNATDLGVTGADNVYGAGLLHLPNLAAAVVPGKPSSATATAHSQSATVAWTAPADDGGASITGYTVSSSADGKQCTWTTGPLSCNVTGLTNGTPYTFTVTATNSAGTGPASDPSNEVTPALSAPGKPVAVAASAGNTSASVSWSAPGDNGGLAITGYAVTSSPDGRQCTWTSGPLTCTVTDLTNGTPYTFTVTATNDQGTSSPSDPSNTVTPAQPETVDQSDSPAGMATSTLYHQAQTFTAGKNGRLTGVDLYLAVSSQQTVHIYIRAVNGSGLPTGSNLDSSTLVLATQSAGWVHFPLPGLVNVNSGTKYAVVLDNGGSFAVSWSWAGSYSGGQGMSANDAGDSSWTTNDAVYGAWDFAFKTYVTSVTQPGKPTAVTATGHNHSATVAWSAPADNGGANITAYTVNSSAGGLTCGWTSGPLTCTVTGLTNGTPYTFTVTGTNSAGPGLPSDPSNEITPAPSTPGKPTSVTASRGNTAATVSWSAPADNGGTTITAYTVTSSPDGHTCGWTSGPLTCTVTGLTNGQSYTFIVRATNGQGVGSPSDPSSSVTPATTPGKPSAPTATSADSSATVSWSAPASNGGSSIIGYAVTSSPGGKQCTWSSGPLTCTVTDLTNGTPYTFRVSATNGVGTGSASDPSGAVTPRAPTTAVDQYNPAGTSSGISSTHASNHQAQTFTAGATGRLTGVDLYLYADQPETMHVYIRAVDAAGMPTGSNLDSAAAVVPGQAAGWVHFTLPGTVSVAPGDKRAIVFDDASTVGVYWGHSYSGGQGCVSNNANDSTWTNRWTVPGLFDGNWDFAFKTYVGSISQSGSTYHAITPARVLDTRAGSGNMGLTGAFVAGTVRTFGVAGVHYVGGGTAVAVPASATAVTGNLTVTGETASGLIALGPTMTATGDTTTLNFVVGENRANNVTVALGPGGTLAAVYRSSTAGASVNVIFDATGYFTADATGSTYHSLAPGRVQDSRAGSGHIGLAGKFKNRIVRSISISGVTARGWSSALVPASAVAVTANVTVTNATSDGYVALGPTMTSTPKTSTVNTKKGKNTANGLTVALKSGKVAAVWVGTTGSSADVILDITGYFTTGSSGLQFFAVDPYRVLDSAGGTGLSGSFATATARSLAIGGTGGTSGVPAGAKGIAGNLTLILPSSAGYAFIAPSISGPVSSSTVNANSGVSVANGFDVSLDGSGNVMLVWVGVVGSTANLQLDITGYWK